MNFAEESVFDVGVRDDGGNSCSRCGVSGILFREVELMMCVVIAVVVVVIRVYGLHHAIRSLKLHVTC